MQLIGKRLFSLGVALLTVIAGLDPARVHAQSLPSNISPEDIAAFKALPADQRKALMQQYAPDMAAADDSSAIPASDGPSGVPDGNGPKLAVGTQAPSGTVAAKPPTTLQPGDAVFIELTRKVDAVTTPDMDAQDSMADPTRRMPNGRSAKPTPPDMASQEFLDAIYNRNPYDVKADGQLRLPGVPATRVAGLSTASAERILMARPQFAGWTVHLTVLPTVGGVPRRVTPFGLDFFQHGSGKQGLTPSLPVPKDYVLGPDDQIQIEFFGNKAMRYQRDVDRDGVLNVPEFGPISVLGRRFDDVKHELETAAKTKLIGTEVHVTMGRLRSMQVFVLGDVVHPGAYTVSSLSTVLNVLMDAGGPTPVGSMRAILLKRDGQPSKPVDLYSVLLTGDRSRDYALQPGDVVFVPPVGRTAEIEGEVRRPAIYELGPQATLQDLIGLAGGLNATAYSGEITVDRVNREGIREALHVDLGKGQAASLKINDGDRLQIARVIDAVENTIEVQGWVKRPRSVPYRANVHVSDLVPNEDALEHNPDLEYALIAREVGSERRLTFRAFSPREAFLHKGAEQDPTLALHDVVLFFAKDESRLGLLEPLMRRLREEYRDGRPPPMVSVGGPVKLAGMYPLTPYMTLKDALIAAGGEREPDLNYGLIARETGPDRHLTFVPFNPAKLLDGEAEVASQVLEPRDAVLFFPREGAREGVLKGYLDRLRIESRDGAPPPIVSVNGPVAYGGEFPLTPNMTVGDLLTAAGGRKEGVTYSAELAHFEIRDREKRIAKVDSLSLDDAASLSTPLKPYDALTVRPVERSDKSEWTVKLDGAVRFPGTYVLKEHESLVALLKRAGGFASDANPEGLVLLRDEARRQEQAQLDLLTDRLSHELALKSIASTTATGNNSAKDEAKEQTIAAQALLAELKGKKAIGRVALPAGGIERLRTGERYDIPLLGGDRLVVPRRSGTVSVVGEVLSPGAFSVAAGSSVNEFIDLAGGTTRDADRGRAYVVGPDGLARPLGRLSSRGLRDGDTVVVPTDLKKLPPLPMWASVTQILSNMAIGIAAIRNL